jgi:hypothetical protein
MRLGPNFRDEKYRRFLDAELGRRAPFGPPATWAPRRPEQMLVESFARPWGWGRWHRNPESNRLKAERRPRRWWQWRG